MPGVGFALCSPAAGVGGRRGGSWAGLGPAVAGVSSVHPAPDACSPTLACALGQLVCLPPTHSEPLCAPRWGSSAFSPLPCSRVLVLESAPAGLGWARPVLCCVGAAAQPAGLVPVSRGGSTGAQGLTLGEAFPTGLHLPCVTWCLSLCSPAERSCQGFMPSPSCGLHPGRGPSSPLHSSSSREVERHPRRPHLVCEPRCLAGHCRPATRWLTVLSES